MKEFLKILRRFVPPYKKYLVLSVIFNILSAVLNIFSFATLIPILNILFQTRDTEQPAQFVTWSSIGSAEDLAEENLESLKQKNNTKKKDKVEEEYVAPVIDLPEEEDIEEIDLVDIDLTD